MKSIHPVRTLAICAVLSIVLTLACGKKSTIYVKRTLDIEKKACACADNPCARLALKDYQALFEELKQNRATGTTGELRQINESAKKIQECLKKNKITEKEINDIINIKQ
jgi:hypothetical protein